MILGLFHAPSEKEEDLINRMGGSVRSTFQKVERIHELEFLNTSFMLSFHCQLCGCTRIMLLRIIDIIWFYDSWSLSCYLKERRGFEK